MSKELVQKVSHLEKIITLLEKNIHLMEQTFDLKLEGVRNDIAELKSLTKKTEVEQTIIPEIQLPPPVMMPELDLETPQTTNNNSTETQMLRRVS